MADKNKKKRKQPARQWRMPTPEEYVKGNADQDMDLRRRILRYTKTHPDEFPGNRPMGAATARYGSQMASYLGAAHALGRCPTAQSLNAIPMIILSTEVFAHFTDAAELGDKEYYQNLPDKARMSIPMKDVTEFAIATRVPGLGPTESESLIHLRMLDPGTVLAEGSIARKLRITQFYRSSDESYHPCLVVDADLVVKPGGGAAAMARTGEGSDMIGINRNNSTGLLEYFTTVSPDELGWSDSEVEFWEQVTLPHAAYNYQKGVETRADMILANICTATLNVLAKTLSENGFEDYEDTSREYQRMAARPPYLKPDPYMDTRKTWQCGPILYKGHAIPELADGFPDLRNMEEHNGQEETQAGQGEGPGPGGVDAAGTVD